MTVNNVEQSLAAFEFAHSQLWDAIRGLHAAYQVDTGEDAELIVPTWAELPPAERHTFMVAAYRAATRNLMEIVVSIAESVQGGEG